MVGGKKLKLNTNYLVISLALAFVLYHLVQLVAIPASLASGLLPQPTPVIQSKPTQSISVATPVSKPLLGEQADKSLWPTRVSMDTVGLDLPVEGSIEKDGAWNISLTGADFAINTAVPNSTTGNTTIFGHDRPGLFHPIHNLKLGDEVKVYADNKIYTYTVTGNTIVDPSDVAILNQTTQPTLTLITCNGWFSDKRYVVFGKLAHVDSATSQP